MKHSYGLISGSLLLSAFLFFSSCTKQIEPSTDEPMLTQGKADANMQLAETCKPAVFGLYRQGSTGDSWFTIAQKWYDDGKVRYFKGNFSGANPGYGGYIAFEPPFNIAWGEVTYEGNQVYLRDVGKNKRLVLRVTLDAQGRPEASYLDNQTDNNDNAFMKDTTYYYYTGDRLDYIIRFAEIRLYGTSIIHAWNKYTFEYDTYGNMTSATGVRGGPRTNIVYDYTKPVSGNMTNYILTTSFRLMEFLELIKVPMHHAVIETNVGSYPSGTFFMVMQDEFTDHVISNGRVHSYKNTPFLNIKQTFYIGWECGDGAPAPNGRPNNIITSLDQFQQRYSK